MIAGRRLLLACLAAAFVVTGACTRRAGPAGSHEDAGPPSVKALAVRPFKAQVYGASGVTQLPDGRLVVAGDDAYNPLEIIDLFGAGASKVFTSREIKRVLSDTKVGALNDLEALTIDPRGHVYAITSHALTTKGAAKAAREQVVRFDVVRNHLTDVRVSDRLKPALMKLDPMLANSALLEPRERGGLNIEGIAWDPDHSRLLIGFRSPRRDKDALVVWLQNPDQVFDDNQEPSLLAPITLDLGGEGIRDVTYSPTLHAFVIVAGTWRHGKHTATTLWSWRGGDEPPVQLRAPDFDDLNPEGIAEVVSGGERALFIVSDDGNADDSYAKGRSLLDQGVPSRYAILPFSQLPHLPASQHR